MDKYKEKIINSKYIYQGSVLKLRKDKVKLFDGHQTYREVIEHSGGVAIIPITDQGQILMVKQYRIAVDQVVYELPAGKLEVKEEKKECAKRELEEETGFKAGRIKKLFNFYTTPGYSNENLSLYIAYKLKKVGQNLDRGEYIEVVSLNKEDIIPKILKGEIKDSKTIIGLLWYLNEGISDE